MKHFLLPLIFIAFFGHYTLLADGTGQVMPNSSNGTALIVDPATGIGSYRSCPSTQRIYFRVKDFNTERMYFGLHGRVRTPSDGALTNGYYRIFNPSGTQVVGPTAIPTSGTGFISTYAQALAGPDIAGGAPAGYTPIVHTPTVNGDYYIEMYRSNDGGATAVTSSNGEAYFIYFDFTVATAANVRYPGRVHCQEWAFITYDPSGAPYTPQIDNSFEGSYFGYTQDSSVVRVNFQSLFKPFRFTVSMNYEGVANTGNFANDRRSVTTGATAPAFPNPYKVFLYRPDSTIFIRATPTSPPALTGNIYGCPGAYIIPYYTQKAGDISLLLDLNGVAGYQAGTADVTLEAFGQTPGNHAFFWNGINGLGATVSSGASVGVQLTIFLGRTNIPMYDAELNTNGLSVTSIHPSITNRSLYWDDSAVTTVGATCGGGGSDNNNITSPGIAATNLLTGVVGPTHAWDATSSSTAVPAATVTGDGSNSSDLCDDFGNIRSINTWFYAGSSASSIVNKLLPSCDKDNDGLLDASDIDDDNDGVRDVIECTLGDPLLDADADGIPNYLDPDVAGFTDVTFDGVDDRYDFDLDGIINSVDIDSDNDGITDVIESGGSDTDNNGIIGTGAVPTDTDVDGLANVVEPSGNTPIDTDGDGLPNLRDLDSDNDGINDTEENGISDPDGNGVIGGFDVDSDGLFSDCDQNDLALGDAGNTNTVLDNDGDGFPNYRDLDSDNDGINDLTEQGTSGSNSSIVDANSDGVVDSGDTDNDGIRNSADANDSVYGDPDTTDSPLDTDGDALPNYRDLDSDNDGINDLTEYGITVTDANSDGVVDTGDSDNDGIRNSADFTNGYGDADAADNPVDRDSDGIYDMLDLDSDNDAIHDLIESGNTGLTDANSNGVLDAADTDGDGIQNSADATNGFGDTDTNDTPVDTDADGVRDSWDLDSDNDGINDLTESRHTGITDATSDGVVDAGDVDLDGIRTSADANDALFGDPSTTDGPADSDGDGVYDFRDLDSDNDGVNDLVEAANSGIVDATSDGVVDGTDADGDGIRASADATNGYGDADAADTPVDRDSDGVFDMYDLDSDNDGIHDLVEFNISALVDANSDGVVDGTDADGDGIRASADLTNGFGDVDATDVAGDRDGDGVPDYRDLDSDNDGINDLSEGYPTGITDATSDGVVDGPDSDGDGIMDSADNNDAVFGDLDSTDGPLETDGDGIYDFRDLDSDNDGINDLTEGGETVTDATSDGVVDTGDTDGDGIRNSADATAGYGDANASDGPADTDGDGIPNFRDLDSDNDAINDLTELGTSGSNASIADANSDGVVDTGDTDGDGIRNSADATAGYGDADSGDGPVDRDSDGVVDMLDLDSDNDAIHDLIECSATNLTDANSDGVLDIADADGDGIMNAADATNGFGDADSNDAPVDTDSDGVRDYWDLDSDNDGINDLTESRHTGITDATSDGVVDAGDTDGDGIRNSADASSGFGDLSSTDGPADSDGDGVYDFRDLDSDNDGMNDLAEYGVTVTDANSDGVVDATGDTDGDGIRNSADATNGYGDADAADSPIDTDSDGIANIYDLDSDNDGIHDLIEFGIAALVDADSDGVVDGTDADGDGIRASADLTNGFGDVDATDTPNDRDSDSVPDFRDLDSDNDGINDLSEGYPTGVIDANSDGVVDGSDADGDGLRDSADNNDALFGDPDSTDGPLDTDGDTVYDFRDLDSDNDGNNDFNESGATGMTDATSDSVVDAGDTDGDGIQNSADATNGFGDVSAADGPVDTDGDGLPDFRDLDSDNDGINDLTELGTAGSNASIIDANSDGVVDATGDTDGDGIRNSADATNGYGDADSGDGAVDRDADGISDFRDLDSDNDSISDLIESGDVTLTDANSDGVVDGPDSDNDGIRDSADANDALYGDPSTLDTPTDKDLDGVPDYRDLDSDNDGINDLTESGHTGITDANSDGVVDGPDTDSDGIRDSADANDALFGDPDTGDTPFDTDGDGKYDFRDLDSDQDGILDLTETRLTLTDVNSDGVVDGPDTDGDGIRDSADNDDVAYGDPDTGDTPPDSDGDGVMDFRDLDSDNDSVNDVVEGGSGAFDANADGLVDGNDNDGDGINDPVDANDLLYGDPDTTDVLPNLDNGATPDYLDLDSDGDGILDVVEAGNGAFDTNGDGRVDGTDIDGDGIKDVVDDDDTRFGESLVPLPIELVSFDGVKVNDQVKLSWRTASEKNSDFYTLSRSVDGTGFTEIGKVKSKNSVSGAEYVYFDTDPVDGLNYYVLTSVDFDKSSQASNIIAVEFSVKDKDLLIFQADERLIVKSYNHKIRSVNLIDAIGQILKLEINAKNDSFVVLDVSSLSEGVYLVQVDFEENSAFKKVIIK